MEINNFTSNNDLLSQYIDLLSQYIDLYYLNIFTYYLNILTYYLNTEFPPIVNSQPIEIRCDDWLVSL